MGDGHPAPACVYPTLPKKQQCRLRNARLQPRDPACARTKRRLQNKKCQQPVQRQPDGCDSIGFEAQCLDDLWDLPPLCHDAEWQKWLRENPAKELCESVGEASSENDTQLDAEEVGSILDGEALADTEEEDEECRQDCSFEAVIADIYDRHGLNDMYQGSAYQKVPQEVSPLVKTDTVTLADDSCRSCSGTAPEQLCTMSVAD